MGIDMVRHGEEEVGFRIDKKWIELLLKPNSGYREREERYIGYRRSRLHLQITRHKLRLGRVSWRLCMKLKLHCTPQQHLSS